jgi:hypothetical protein
LLAAIEIHFFHLVADHDTNCIQVPPCIRARGIHTGLIRGGLIRGGLIKGGLNPSINQATKNLDVAAPALHSDNRFMKRWSRNNRRHKNHSTAEVISQRQRFQSSNHTVCIQGTSFQKKSKTPYQSSKSSCPTCTPQTIAQAFQVINNLYLFAYRPGVSGHGRLFVEGSVVDSWDSWYIPS